MLFHATYVNICLYLFTIITTAVFPWSITSWILVGAMLSYGAVPPGTPLARPPAGAGAAGVLVI